MTGNHQQSAVLRVEPIESWEFVSHSEKENGKADEEVALPQPSPNPKINFVSAFNRYIIGFGEGAA